MNESPFPTLSPERAADNVASVPGITYVPATVPVPNDIEDVTIIGIDSGDPWVLGKVGGKTVVSCHNCGHMRFLGSSKHVHDFIITRTCFDKLTAPKAG